jgi:GNAT superfamily N-acetyltransferase
MADLAIVQGPYLQQVLDHSHPVWHEGLSRAGYGRYYAAQVATPWGRGHMQRLALVENGEVQASAKLYAFDAILDGVPFRIAGIGALFTAPAHRGRGHAPALVDQLLERAAGDGADLALLFSIIGADYYGRLGFETIATTDLSLKVIEDKRRGAPMTLVRAGEERDLADVVAIGRVRAERYRFHLDRDRDFVHYAIVKKRLLAGLGSAGRREVLFFIAEEGASAAAYVVITVHGGAWVLEECGDRDPDGARVGAILQVLIARDPSAVRPAISAWLPPGFRPPQIEVLGERPSPEIMMMRPLRGPMPQLSAPGDLLFWHGDMF